MKISNLADYASVLLMALSQTPAQWVSAHALAEATRLPSPTVSKLLKKCVTVGWVRSSRGPHGGYQLCVRLDSITLDRLIEAIDGPIKVTRCIESDDCRLKEGCLSHGHWQLASAQIKNILSSINLGPLKTGAAVSVPVPAFEKPARRAL